MRKKIRIAYRVKIRIAYRVWNVEKNIVYLHIYQLQENK